MKAVLQRVHYARLSISGKECAAIGPGLLVLLGVGKSDENGNDNDKALLERLARKTLQLRIFEDEQGRMNRSLMDVGGDCLIVSQFTLHADARKGLRPSFTGAAAPEAAERMYNCFVETCRRMAPDMRIQTGVFAADMQIELLNDGPVTIILDTGDW
ncbi:MAG: D-tyrosyl-tRNA(Tyr) deacylase [Leptospiraceae bacterium]|nr:D-tyrosyl-tRNA(Tyr) deacylase [Leptospiraceae bacterium]